MIEAVASPNVRIEDMLKEILIVGLTGFVVYEAVEHLLLPVYWLLRQRGRKSACGPAGMIGQKCVVKTWRGERGKVRYGAELWDAVSQSPLTPGSEAVILDVRGLTLQVTSADRSSSAPTASSA